MDDKTYSNLGGWDAPQGNAAARVEPPLSPASRSPRAAHRNRGGQSAPWSAGIYQEVDGFYYYDPLPGTGSYAAHTLREIADKLDEMNQPWLDQIERELNQDNEKGQR